MKNNNTYAIMTETGYDSKKQKNETFLENLSKERTRQNTALGMSNTRDYDLYSKNLRYENELKNPSDDTKALQTSLNDFGYTDKNGNTLKVDGAYGPKTDYAYNTAMKNNAPVIEKRELAKQRDEVADAVNKAYEPMQLEIENKKLNMPEDEVIKTQEYLNNLGHTDWWGKPLKVDGVLGPKTKQAFFRHINENLAKQEVLDLQKVLNKYEIKDKDGNPLKQDGKLGIKTDSAVHNAVAKLGGIKDEDLEPVAYNTITTANLLSKPEKRLYDNLVYYSNPILSVNSSNYMLPTNILSKNTQNRSLNMFEKISNNFDTNDLLDYNKIPNIPRTAEETDTSIRSLQAYCEVFKFKDEDVENIQKVLNCYAGVNLDVDGDIGVKTSYQICKFAKNNDFTLAQACDELKKAGKVYDSIYSDMQLSQHDLTNIQMNANKLGYKNANGNNIGIDGLIGYDTLSVINDYAISNDVGLKTAAIDLRDGNTHGKEKQNLESLILDKGKDFEKDENSFFNYDKVSKLFSNTKDVNFDHNNITKVYLLNNTNGAKGFGHNALMLVDDNGCGAFFSYYSSNSEDLVGNITGKQNGEMRFKALHTNEVISFLNDDMPLLSIISSDGEYEKESYTGFVPMDITTEQGTKMLDCAVEFFVKPGLYGLFENDKDDYQDNKWQCDSVTRAILEIGGIDTNGRPWPDWSFGSTKFRN